MTDEQFEKASQIREDIKAIKAIKEQTLRVGASTELKESWKDWANTNLKRLEKEFEEL